MDHSPTIDQPDAPYPRMMAGLTTTLDAGESPPPTVGSSLRRSAAGSVLPQLVGEIRELYCRRLREVGLIAGATAVFFGGEDCVPQSIEYRG